MNTEGGFRSKMGNVTSSNVIVGHYSSISVSRLSNTQNAELRELFDELRSQVLETAPDEQREEALERVATLEKAVGNDDQPDIPMMESVLTWFKRKIPALAGAVLSVIVNPIVGQLVSAGGELLVSQFQQRFGGE